MKKLLSSPSVTPRSQYKKKSNKQVIKNALTQVSLPGEINKALREEVLEMVDETDFDNYLIMFKGVLGGTGYRALYSNGSKSCQKIHGAATAPD